MHALGIPHNETARDILRNNWGIKLGIEFVLNLINNGILNKNDNGKIIVYFRDSQPVHAGILSESKRVTSK